MNATKDKIFLIVLTKALQAARDAQDYLNRSGTIPRQVQQRVRERFSRLAEMLADRKDIQDEAYHQAFAVDGDRSSQDQKGSYEYKDEGGEGDLRSPVRGPWAT